MAMTFLKKAKAFQPTQSVKYLLHSHLNGPDPARPMSRMHASELTKPEGFCPRHYALADVTKTKPKDNWLTTSEEVTFHIGRVLQDAVVNWFADMGKAFCHWKCQGCGHVHEFQLRPMKCVSCGSKNFWPKEVRFESAETGASCGVDMLVALGEKKLKPVELKTMDKDQFKELKGPLAEHRLQNQPLSQDHGGKQLTMVQYGQSREGDGPLHLEGRLGLRRPAIEGMGAEGAVQPVQGIRDRP